MPINSEQPSLFGLNKTNRDYTKEATWGKNQFNSSFPASLCCYLASKNIGSLPRTDLVTQKESTGECLQGLEIKLDRQEQLFGYLKCCKI